MKTCQECGSTNRDEARFCLTCGVRLVQAPQPLAIQALVEEPSVICCPACLTENDPANFYCENCGQTLAPAPISPLSMKQELLSIPSIAAPESDSATDVEPGELSLSLVELPVVAAGQTELPTTEPVVEDAALERVVEQGTGDGAEVSVIGFEERPVVENMVCLSCQAVLRFCPCCGQPLSTHHVKE